MSLISQNQKDAHGLRRMQDLDKSLFGTGGPRNKLSTTASALDDGPSSHGYTGSRPGVPWGSSAAGSAAGAQLPPLMAAWPDNSNPGLEALLSAGRHGNAGAAGPSLSLPYSPVQGPPIQSPRLYGAPQQRPRSHGAAAPRRAANAKPPRRGATGPTPLEPIVSSSVLGSLAAFGGGQGATPLGHGANPWEALLDAAPATRYGSSLARDGGGLQLLMPSGSSRESAQVYEHRLTSYLAPMSGPSGTASVVPVAAAAAGGPRGCSPSRLPLSPLQFIATSTAAAVIGSGTGQGAPGGESLLSGSSLPPLVPRSAVSTALSAPAPGSEPPWGGAGLPYSTHNAVAEVRGGMVAGVAATLRDSAEYGSGGGTVGEAWDDPQSPPLLGQLITGRPSNRRQVQLMADWLDGTIGLMWEHHLSVLAAAAATSGAAGGGKLSTEAIAAATAASGLIAGGGGGSGPAESAVWRPAGGGGGGGGGPAGVVAVGAPATATAAGGGGAGSKAALAMRFTSVNAGLRDLSANLYGISTQPQLWASIVEATAAVAQTLVHNVAHRCWEEGALLARLWNLNTALLDSGLAAARKAQEQLAATAAEQEAKIRRLDPLIDWELESRVTKESLAVQLEAARAEALLAGRERDALLRENDKIIAHYRKELKTYRSEQRRNAYRLARKLRNTQQQLELMTRDRDILYNAVSYTKTQTAQMVDIIGGMHGHVRGMAGPGQGPVQVVPGGRGPSPLGGVTFAVVEEAFPELDQIEQGLKNILHSVTKVRDVNQDAEDSHFVMEEQVTAVAAADTVGDELVDEVLAEGDPEPSPEEEAAAAALAATQKRAAVDSSSEYDSDEPDPNSALSMLAEAALRGTGESSEEEEGDGQGYDGDGDEGDGSAEVGRGRGDGAEGTEGEGLLGEVSAADADAAVQGIMGSGEGGAGDGEGEEGETRERITSAMSLRRSSSRSPAPRATGSSLVGEEGGAAGSGRRTPLSTSVSRSRSPDLPISPTAKRPPSGSGLATVGSGGKKKKNKNKGGKGGAGGAGGASGAVYGSAGTSLSGAAGREGGEDGTLRSVPGEVRVVTPGGSIVYGRTTTPGGTIVEVGSASFSAHGGHGSSGPDGHRGYTFSATPPPGQTSGSGTPLSVSPPSTSQGMGAAATPPPRRAFNVASAGSQTSPDLMRGMGDPEVVESARQMKVLREALCEIGIMGNPNDDADGTDGLLTALRQYMASLSQESGALSTQLEKARALAEAAEAARVDLSQTAEARGREVAAFRRELLEAKKRFSQLCDQLEAIGIDPRAPTLPAIADGLDSPRGAPPDRTVGSRGGVGKGGRSGLDASGETNGRSKAGGKVSRLAAVKEKARERLLAAQAPVLGRASYNSARHQSAASGPPSRVQLPAAMLAAAAARAAEAAAAGEADAAGGGGTVAAGISAWRSVAGGGGGGGGPLPVYIRPDRAAATARLQDALTRYADAKPRTLEWLLKLIDSMYRGKAVSDDQRAKIGQEPLTMIEYMFQHLSGQYGTKDLVNQYAAQLVATCLQYCATDARVGTFQRFLMEEWDTRVLVAYMDATRRLQEPTRVPCCDFPADYLPAGARKVDSAPVDIRKALWVAERVLLRRSPKAAYVFAQLLNSRAEPITQAELDSYFVSPGSYGAELQQVRQFETSRAEFKRVSSAVFLDTLCGEYARMENVYREVLPELFSRYDGDSDGWITRPEIAVMVHDVFSDMTHAGVALPDGAVPGASGGGAGGAGVPITEADRDAVLDALWNILSTAEADARTRADSSLVYPDGATRGAGGGVVSAAAVTHLSDSGFLEGALRSDFLRGWVRAFKTGAAPLPGGAGALAEVDLHAARESARRLLSVLVCRHWVQHGEVLEGYFAEAGALAEQQLKQQAALLDGDMGGSHGDGRDGPKRAAALCTMLRLLLVKKADRFTSLLSSENLTGGPHNGPPIELEDLLCRLTAAVRLLYGPPDSIWVVGAELDELAALSLLDAADVEALPAGYKKWVATVGIRCCALHDRLHLSMPPSPLVPQLQNHRGVPHYARLWRKATAVAVAARRRASIAAAARTPPFGAARLPTPTPAGGAATTTTTTNATNNGSNSDNVSISVSVPNPSPNPNSNPSTATAAPSGTAPPEAPLPTPPSPAGITKALGSTSGTPRRTGSGAHPSSGARSGSTGRPTSGQLPVSRGSARSPSDRPESGARPRALSPPVGSLGAPGPSAAGGVDNRSMTPTSTGQAPNPTQAPSSVPVGDQVAAAVAMEAVVAGEAAGADAGVGELV